MVKKVAVVILLFSVVFAGTAFAQQKKSATMKRSTGVSVDGFIGLGTEPADDLGSTIGLGVGASLDLEAFGADFADAENMQVRADISYFKWEEDMFGVDVSLRRIPVFGGVRYFFTPEAGRRASDVGLYGEGGLELSFDEAEAAVCVPFLGCVSGSSSEINLGITVGGGVEMPVAENMYIGANLRYHLISDSYFTIMASFGVKVD